MKTISTLLLILLVSSTGVAQFYEVLVTKKQLSESTLTRLKGTTTVFFYPNDNNETIENLKTAISSGWTMTPLIFDEYRNYAKYASDPKYSFFVIEGLVRTIDNSPITEYYLVLRVFKELGKNGKVVTEGLAMSYLYPSSETVTMARARTEEVMPKVYAEGKFYNWNPVILKAIVQVMETNITKGIRPTISDDIKSKNISRLLANDTLYVPKSILRSFKVLNGVEEEKSENVFASYKNPYRICTPEELYQIFEVQKRGRLLFEYVRNSSVKYVTIYDLKDKTVVYRKVTVMSYNLKEKDIERLD